MATLSEFGALELLPAATRTASANGTGVDLQKYTNPGGRAMKAVLEVGTVTGTSPTLDVKMQQSDDNSTFADISGAAFAQVTAAGLSELHFQATKRYVRAVATIGGTSPSFPCAVVILAQKRNA
jgi:hypothetical protein